LLEASHRVQSLATRPGAAPPGPLEAQIIADLAVEGVHVTTVERLLPHMADDIRGAFTSAEQILREDGGVREGRSLWSRASTSTDLRADVLLTRLPVLYTLGLEPHLLTLVHHYLRLPVAYHGAVVRHSLVDGAGAGPRLWHMDAEDFHVFRMVIYMNDVLPGGGPFEYIPRSLGVTYKSFDRPDQLTNERMRAVVPEKFWKRVYGPAGTVVIADTARTFHHESLQTERARSVVMIGYSSRRPKAMELAMAHFPVEKVRPILTSMVPSANYEHVFNWRRQVSTRTQPAVA
jgi:hypothetical protein